MIKWAESGHWLNVRNGWKGDVTPIFPKIEMRLLSGKNPVQNGRGTCWPVSSLACAGGVSIAAQIDGV